MNKRPDKSSKYTTLLTAAPDLLKAAKLVQQLFTSDSIYNQEFRLNVLKQLGKAIDKAEGK